MKCVGVPSSTTSKFVSLNCICLKSLEAEKLKFTNYKKKQAEAEPSHVDYCIIIILSVFLSHFIEQYPHHK